MIRTRFAPSPTGYLHVGGLRTALYAYLFARKNKGTFVLRIEDTDQTRYVEGAVENLIETLNWNGISYEEGPEINEHGKIEQKGALGPYVQSERTGIYKEHAQKLLDSGHAYRCFCTKERLDEMRGQQMARGQGTMYDRKCCDLPDSEIKKHLDAGTPFVIRQKIPYIPIKFKDLIRKNVQFDGKTIDDQVLVKSDGFPTYHLANVVDDHLMKITHVIRGEEWLPSTPKHIALYQAFGWEAPIFAHIPLLLNEDRTKLSKRQGDVAVEQYIEKGYLREAVLNFVAFLGWHPGGGEEKEIFTLPELEEIFTMEKVHKAGAIFNLEKLDWYNWRWLKQKHVDALEEIARGIDQTVEIEEQRKGQLTYNFATSEQEAQFTKERGQLIQEICKKYLAEGVLNDESRLHKILIVSEEKVLKNPKEVQGEIDFFYEQPDYNSDLLTHEKMRVDLNQACEALKAAKESLSQLENWNLASIKEELIAKVQELGIKNGQLLWPLRAALSGLQFSPGAFETAWALGKEETLNRIDTALSKTS
jgi:glutamyl-tRNA synthetase